MIKTKMLQISIKIIDNFCADIKAPQKKIVKIVAIILISNVYIKGNFQF